MLSNLISFGTMTEDMRRAPLSGSLLKLKSSASSTNGPSKFVDSLALQWTKRWFTIEGKYLHWYRSSLSSGNQPHLWKMNPLQRFHCDSIFLTVSYDFGYFPEPSGSVDLRTVVRIGSSSTNDDIFFVKTDARNFTFRANSNSEALKWVRCLHMYVDLAKGGSGCKLASPSKVSSTGHRKTNSLEKKLDDALRALSEFELDSSTKGVGAGRTELPSLSGFEKKESNHVVPQVHAPTKAPTQLIRTAAPSLTNGLEEIYLDMDFQETGKRSFYVETGEKNHQTARVGRRSYESSSPVSSYEEDIFLLSTEGISRVYGTANKSPRSVIGSTSTPELSQLNQDFHPSPIRQPAGKPPDGMTTARLGADRPTAAATKTASIITASSTASSSEQRESARCPGTMQRELSGAALRNKNLKQAWVSDEV
jgi:PH domain